VEVNEVPSDGQIRNSNSHSIAAYAAQAGALVQRFDSVPDTVEATCDALESAAARHDVVITSGGVSMGDYDLVKEALTRIGAHIFFDRVRIRPGKPIVFARRGPTCFFGLPGNPVSTSVTFNVFARPALRRLQDAADPLLETIRAEAGRAVVDPSDRRSYLPARLALIGARVVAEPLKWGGSSDLAAFINANALIIVPETVHEIPRGSQVDALLLRPL
jgi:molybdenum cofactor synthesis domain-containing protein